MGAVAYAVALTAAIGSPNGQRKIFNLTASDVANEYWLFPSGSSEMTLHGTSDVYIVDVNIAPASGTDTTHHTWYVNGAANGIKMKNATCLYTAINRPYQLAPLRIPAGQSIKVKQEA